MAIKKNLLENRRARQILLMFFGFFLAVGQPPFGAIYLAYPALVAAIYLLATSKRLFAESWIFGTAFFVLSLSWIVSPFMVEPWKTGWMAPFALFFMALGLGLFWAVACRITKKMPAKPLALALGLAVAELARGYVFTGFPWGLIGTIWIDLPVMQLAAWVGTYGVTFLTLLAAAVAVIALGHWKNGLGLLVAALPVIALLGLGALRNGETLQRDQPYVRLIQPNAPQKLKFQRDFALQNFDESLALTAEPSETPIDIVIWPETSLPFWVDQAEFALLDLADQANGARVLVGANRRENTDVYNSLLVVEPDGQVSQIYDKRHLVPFGEYLPFSSVLSKFGIKGLAAFENYGYRKGQSEPLLDLGDAGLVQAAICYEAVFPQGMRAISKRPDWIVQVTNDAWFGNFTGPQQHLAQARLRSIELGLPIARSANTGITSVIDAKGDVMAALALNTQGRLDVALPMPYAATFYTKWGELPLLIGIFLLGLVIWFRKRRVFH